MPTKTEVYIQHIFKEFKSLGKQLKNIHLNDSSKIVKMYPKNRNSFTKTQYKVYLYKEERRAKILQNLTINFVIRRREMNITLLSDEVGQVFNLRLCILDGL
jgi:hypothetical protein